MEFLLHKLITPTRNDVLMGVLYGGPEEARTPDLCVANAALSQLSYRPKQQILYTTSANLTIDGPVFYQDPIILDISWLAAALSFPLISPANQKLPVWHPS
jgi:hypothetical protein